MSSTRKMCIRDRVGIPTVQTKILAYVICGIMAAVAGMVYASRIGFITPTAGNNYEMKAIAACVLGCLLYTSRCV